MIVWPFPHPPAIPSSFTIRWLTRRSYPYSNTTHPIRVYNALLSTIAPFNPVPSAPLRALDALSLFQEDEVVITSPNMTFIPKPFLNSSELRAFKDGRYGVQDVFQWPQLYSDKYPYSTCIPRREWLNLEPCHLLWWTPKPSDFVKEAGTMWEVGRLPEGHRAAFTELHDYIHDQLSQHAHYLDNDLRNLMKPAATLRTLKQALERLHYHPLTFRELTLQVAEFQRTALDILAYGFYARAKAKQNSKVRLTLMGAFTSTPHNCQRLFDMGIPVWFIRHRSEIPSEMRIIDVVDSFDLPREIVMQASTLNGQEKPFPLVYVGRPSDNRQFFNRLVSRTEYDLYKPGGKRGLWIPLAYLGIKAPRRGLKQLYRESPPAPVSNSQGKVKKAKSKLKPAPYQARKPNERGFTRDKWSDVDSELSPPSIVIWKEARSAVDQAPHRVRADVPKPAVYPFPDPALFMTPPAWINRVYIQVCSDSVPTAQMWRDFLYCMGEVHQTSSTLTRSAKDIEATARLFGPEFLDLHSSAADADTLAAVSFRDIVLDLRDFSQVSKEILQRHGLPTSRSA
ncbi:hypothetical protein BU15DRAFT_84156 [Melanogaster broomeanus]|nr:hypothetical protein BU15DRAFT_84156 [Melanogaster broomeanus]